VGTTVDIQGAGFTDGAGGAGVTSVSFNGTAASYSVDSDSHLQATVPAGAATGPISVTTAGGTITSSASFTVTTPLPPTITALTPTRGPVGTIVQIQGAHFTGATRVTFNGTNASFSVDSDSQLQAIVPAGATIGPVSVTTPGGTATSSSSFAPPPRISGFSPTYGKAGQQVTITGSNFVVGATSVKLGATSAKTTVNSRTKITAVVPNIGRSSYKWSVTTASGTATSTAYFQVR
jgi:hypothetical protein